MYATKNKSANNREGKLLIDREKERVARHGEREKWSSKREKLRSLQSYKRGGFSPIGRKTLYRERRQSC